MVLLIRRFLPPANLIPIVRIQDFRTLRADSHAAHFMPSFGG